MKIKSALSLLCLHLIGIHCGAISSESLPLNNTDTNFIPAIPVYSNETIIANFNSSLARFIRERYNERGYAKELSQNGSDLITLLTFVKNTTPLGIDRITYSYTILKLMLEKMKSWDCKLIDDTVVHEILRALPSLFGDYFTAPDFSLKTIKVASTQRITLWSQNFMNRSLDEQRADIHTLPSIVKNECARFRKEIKSLEEARNKLRGMVVRLIEHMLGKITWSMSSYESIWPSVQTIAYDLHCLFKKSIINDEDDLDSTYWSLLHGLCNYLDIVGPYIPISTYKIMARDIVQGAVPFLECEEQDDCINTKKKTLIRFLKNLQPRVNAFQKKGILLDTPIIS